MEHMIREMVRASKTLLDEERHPLIGWVQVVPLVFWAISAVYREGLLACPLKVGVLRESRTRLPMPCKAVG